MFTITRHHATLPDICFFKFNNAQAHSLQSIVSWCPSQVQFHKKVKFYVLINLIILTFINYIFSVNMCFSDFALPFKLNIKFDYVINFLLINEIRMLNKLIASYYIN